MAKKNANLHSAKRAKNDEFYTQLSDIEKEMKHYKDFFKGKVVFCNCDDARESNFFKYFANNFEFLGLKKLICMGYKENGKGVILIYEGDKNGNSMVDDEEIVVTELEGNGDFRSEESIKYLKECDVVVTNPPFSLFREYVAQLMEYGKKFLIIGDGNAVTYKEIFPYIKNNELWLGVEMKGCQQSVFIVPTTRIDTNTKERMCDGKMKYSTIVNTASWFTNIPHNRRNIEFDLYKKYSADEYPTYDNYNAINVNKVSEIPMDYNGVMGVPISFLGKYCPTQFEIVGIMSGAKGETFTNGNDGRAKFYLNDKGVYARILIRRKSLN